MGGQRGSRTDRGRIYVELGPPELIEAHPSGGPGHPDPFEIWSYRRTEEGKLVEEFLVAFGGTDYRLPSPGAATP